MEAESSILLVKGKDSEISIKITSVNVDIATPNNSMAKSSSVASTLCITGKLTHNNMALEDKETLKLFRWSLVTAQNADAYRDVTVKIVSADYTFRTIHFPNAFVIDYSERHSTGAGMGDFSLTLRQRADKFTDITVD
ncbi:hypothetical protein [Anaerosinus massiliensis]|uniref:hypothetical protein n=1 Tax=Massilibacillus massiliensis TaxID=1806837 RepID=UPI0018FE3CAC|nr:hypothetical protein [Massilibacillus massiliensis]